MVALLDPNREHAGPRAIVRMIMSAVRPLRIFLVSVSDTRGAVAIDLVRAHDVPRHFFLQARNSRRNIR